MQVELIGCTSTGKSTLARRILRDFHEQGIPAVASEEFVLRTIGAGWVGRRFVREALIDVTALIECLLTWHRNGRFCRFALRVVARLPVGWHEKLTLSRHVLRKVGIYEFIRHNDRGRQVVLVDEGTLHAAHNLFAYSAAQPTVADIATFARLVPLPHIAVYIRQDKRVLLARTIRRGHRRVPPQSPKHAARFVSRAVEAFETLVRQTAVRRRVLVVDQSPNGHGRARTATATHNREEPR